MKKNKIMRIAAILTVVTLLSTCAISSTFAKYTTQDSASDTARVAKWGVILQVDGKLYGEQYADGASSKPAVSSYAGGFSVKVASTGTNVVAPGTENDTGFGFSINGVPEVDTQLTATITTQNIFLAAGTYGQMVKANVSATSFEDGTYYTESSGTYTKATAYDSTATYYTLEDDVKLDAAYYPVIYKTTDKQDGTITADSLSAIGAYIAKQLSGAEVTPTTTNGVTTYTVTKKYEQNTDLGTTTALADETITWAWAIEQGNDETAKANNNKADTILGLLEQTNCKVVKLTGESYGALTEYTDYCIDTQFGLDITITQVD